MDDAAIKLETRIWALECLFSLQMAGAHAGAIDPAKSFAEMRDALVAKARAQAFPKLDPAMSDHLSAEFETAIARLLDMQRVWLGLPRE